MPEYLGERKELTLRLPVELYAEVKRVAAEHTVSANALIVAAVSHCINTRAIRERESQ